MNSWSRGSSGRCSPVVRCVAPCGRVRRRRRGQFISAVTRLFAASYPDCDVRIRENQVNDAFRLLRDGEIDLLFTTLPIVEPDLATSEVILRENPLLAVCARHPFARRESVSLADLARATVLRSPEGLPEYWDKTVVTGGGAFGERGPAFTTIQEMLALIGANAGVYPVPRAGASLLRPPGTSPICAPRRPALGMGTRPGRVR